MKKSSTSPFQHLLLLSRLAILGEKLNIIESKDFVNCDYVEGANLRTEIHITYEGSFES